MSVLYKLASALERNDERPNVELAEALVAKPDKTAIAMLADALSTGSVAMQNDAIKVLYEIGERAPELVAPHADAFFLLLQSSNNRNVWGAMSAIDTIAGLRPKEVAGHLKAILAAADKGSVIAKDKAMSILAKLAQAGEAEAMPRPAGPAGGRRAQPVPDVCGAGCDCHRRGAKGAVGGHSRGAAPADRAAGQEGARRESAAQAGEKLVAAKGEQGPDPRRAVWVRSFASSGTPFRTMALFQLPRKIPGRSATVVRERA
jgi:hypothetical protein